MAAAEALRLWNDWHIFPEKAANYFSTAGDLRMLTLLAAELGSLDAKFYVKEYGGKLHLALKGNQRLRTILTGTKYGVANPKVVNMGLGYLGAMKSIHGGRVLTAILVSAVDVLNEVLRDDPSMTRLIGTLAVDVSKIEVSTAASMAAVTLMYGGAAVGASLALGPLAVAIIVGVGVGLALDYLDDRYKLKERLATMLSDVAESTSRKLEEAREGLLDAGERIVSAAFEAVVDEIGRRFVRFVSDQVDRLRWFPIPRL